MRFNTESVGTKTTNLAGGDAYKVDPKFELVSILLTSFVKDGFYRSADDTLAKLKTLIKQTDPLFVAKAAVFARREYGMRSITHVAAGEIAKNAKGETWTKRFFARVFKRPDDMLETVAYYESQYGKHPIPNSLKKGVALAISEYNEYTLAKYRGEGKSIKMVDLVNLCHPKNTPAIKKLVAGELKSTETWEAKLTEAGKSEEGEEKKSTEKVAELKAEAWRELLETGKLGYFALLRNLRNIEKQAPDLIPLAAKALTNRDAIKRCLILPFQYLKAVESIKNQLLTCAVSDALSLSLDNCPKLPGSTAVVLDSSGSMQSANLWDTAKLFGAVLFKSNSADIFSFSSECKQFTAIPTDSLPGIMGRIPYFGGGTDFHSIFKALRKPYDRIIILSDMQGWVGQSAPTQDFWIYKKSYKCNPFIYSIDLAGLGTMQIPEPQTFLLAGFSEKIFDTMRMLEEDRNALIKRIEAEVI